MTTNLDMDVGKGGHLFTAGRSADWCRHYAYQCNGFQKYGAAIGHKGLCILPQRYLLIHVHCSSTHSSQQMEIA